MSSEDRPLRVLQVLRAPVGGLFRHVADLTRGLVERGHQVGLVMDTADAGPRWEAVIAELKALAALGLHRLPMARKLDWRDVTATATIRRIASEMKVDVIHGHGAKGGAYARIAGTLLSAASRPARFYTPHGGSLHFSPTSLEGRLYHGLERALASRGEAILFESAFAREGFAATLGLSDPRWPVIPNGLAPEEFEPVALEAGAVDILYIGEMRDLKGVDVLIAALGRMPGVTALLVGAGPDLQRYQADVAARGLSDRVAFAAPMPARQAFAKGGVVVVPSRAESLPYLVLEAVAAAKPLIATRVGGIPEIFGPEESGALIPPADDRALMAALEAALADPEAAAARAERVRAHVATRFVVGRMVDAILSTYRAGLNHRGTTAA